MGPKMCKNYIRVNLKNISFISEFDFYSHWRVYLFGIKTKAENGTEMGGDANFELKSQWRKRINTELFIDAKEKLYIQR